MRIFLWIGCIVGLLLLVFIFQLAGPNSDVEISKQTTYITAPLRADGLPDYEQYIRQKMREGITTENNAAVLLVQALWPAELDAEDYEAVLNELGLDQIPSADAALKPAYGEANRKRVLDWMQKTVAGDAEPDPDSIIDAALDHAWTAKQIPPLVKWVDDNQKPLDQIVEASRRPRYYSPSPTLLDDRHDILISALLPGAQSVREAGRGLSLRAMRRVGDNQLNKGWQDILAIYRLSGLVAQGPFLVEQLVAMALRSIACQATAALLSNPRLTNELARQIQKDLTSVRPLANVANCVDQMERISVLDSVVYASIHGFDALSNAGAPNDERTVTDHSSVDWNIVLRKLNREFDDAAAAMRIPAGTERRRAFDKFNARLDKEADRTKQVGTRIAAFFSRDARSEVIGSIFAALMLPALDAASNAEDRTNSVLALTQLSAALAVYRTSHDAYPEKLDDLVPAVISKLPVDAYQAQPFVYKRLGDGYLLYTIGLNGKDDAGSNNQVNTFEGRPLDDLEPAEADTLREKIPNDADDFSIRIPQPLIKLPAARASETEK
jgi:hypothetical protein